MPSPLESFIPQGVDPTLGVVGQGGLNVPGRAERPRTERLEQLKGVLAAAGQAMVAGVEGQARLAAAQERNDAARRARHQSLYNWVKQKKIDEDNQQQRAYREDMARRLKAIEQEQFDLLRDERSENSEWLLNEAVMRQNNAEYPEQRQAWNDFVLRAQQQQRGDARRAAEDIAKQAQRDVINATRVAARTAKTAIDELWDDIRLDVDLKQQLIGNGRGINDRVNSYVLGIAQSSAPELFRLNKRDPQYAEKLEQQQLLVDQLYSYAQTHITKNLTSEYIAESNRTMEVAGGEAIDAGTQAFSEGRMDAEAFHDLVGTVLRTNFAHVDPRQRDALREKLYRQTFDNLATLTLQSDPGLAVERMESLLRVADLNDNEKQIIRADIIEDKFPKAVKRVLEDAFLSQVTQRTQISTLNNGALQVAKDPRTVEVEMLNDGVFRDEAGKLLDRLGIRPGEELTPLRANLLNTITKVAIDAEDRARKHVQSAQEAVFRTERFLSGQTLLASEASKQWEDGILMRMLTGRLSVDDPVYSTIATEYKAKTGKTFPWNGQGPMPINNETMPVLRDIALAEGMAWSANKSTPIPAELAQALSAGILQADPSRAELSLAFWQGLSPDSRQRVGAKLDARTLMVLTEADRIRSQTAQGQRMDISEVINKVRTIDQNAAVAALEIARNQADLNNLLPNPNYRFDYAKALARALGKDELRDEYGETVAGYGDSFAEYTFDATGSKAASSLLKAFGTDQGLIPLFAQMALAQRANPGASLDECATVVASRMQSQGYKIISTPQGKQVIKDPYQHYPTDVTPGILMQQNVQAKLSQSQAEQFIARLPDAGPRTRGEASKSVSIGDILWTYLDELGAAEGRMTPIPRPDQWSFEPIAVGPMFEGLMNSRDGGVPMQLRIPGEARIPLLVDKSGAPLLVVSSNRRTTAPNPVNRAGIPDFYLTPDATRGLPFKPDSSDRIREMMELAVPYGPVQ